MKWLSENASLRHLTLVEGKRRTSPVYFRLVMMAETEPISMFGLMLLSWLLKVSLSVVQVQRSVEVSFHGNWAVNEGESLSSIDVFLVWRTSLSQRRQWRVAGYYPWVYSSLRIRPLQEAKTNVREMKRDGPAERTKQRKEKKTNKQTNKQTNKTKQSKEEREPESLVVYLFLLSSRTESASSISQSFLGCLPSPS